MSIFDGQAPDLQLIIKVPHTEIAVGLTGDEAVKMWLKRHRIPGHVPERQRKTRVSHVPDFPIAAIARWREIALDGQETAIAAPLAVVSLKVGDGRQRGQKRIAVERSNFHGT